MDNMEDPQHVRAAVEKLVDEAFDNMNDWEKEFIQNVKTRQFFTLKQKRVISDMLANHLGIGKAQGTPQQPPTFDGVEPKNEGGAWKMYLFGTAIGDVLSKKEASLIAEWLNTAKADIEAMIGKKQEEKAPF